MRAVSNLEVLYWGPTIFTFQTDCLYRVSIGRKNVWINCHDLCNCSIIYCIRSEQMTQYLHLTVQTTGYWTLSMVKEKLQVWSGFRSFHPADKRIRNLTIWQHALNLLYKTPYIFRVVPSAFHVNREIWHCQDKVTSSCMKCHAECLGGPFERKCAK